jgi:hypothetical protein
MEEDKQPDWRELCKAAAEEQDPKRLLGLVMQINALLAGDREEGRDDPSAA